jgi:hypothetical protein
MALASAQKRTLLKKAAIGLVRRDADATPGVHFSKAATTDTKRALSDARP